jgi:hypothetical protein
MQCRDWLERHATALARVWVSIRSCSVVGSTAKASYPSDSASRTWARPNQATLADPATSTPDARNQGSADWWYSTRNALYVPTWRQFRDLRQETLDSPNCVLAQVGVIPITKKLSPALWSHMLVRGEVLL